jgi:hypothetical protein
MESLNRWAFSKASNFSNSVDNDLAALGFISRADLVATLIGVCLGKGVDSDAESDGDNGVVEEHDERVIYYLQGR